MSVKGRHHPAGVPGTPRVISPSPTPSESADASAPAKDPAPYGGPVTRSAARRRRDTPHVVDSIDEEDSDSIQDPDPGRRRARTRSRSPIDPRNLKALTAAKPAKKPRKEEKVPVAPLYAPPKQDGLAPNGNSNGAASKAHLSPPSSSPAQTAVFSTGWSWRDISRSPSPLGLIPIHRHWRTFVHKHEVPRKALHVSIGFFTLWLYVSGVQVTSVTPWLMAALIPVTFVDYLRHNVLSFNRLYVKILGALMRESEYNGWNGVIFYLAGAWAVLFFFPKDVGMMGILLLSWCDTAASTFGRLWGRYTPRIRRGKSLAGSLAAFVVGVATAAWFWGVFAPSHGPYPGDENFPFMFTGTLRLPRLVTGAFGLTESQSSISGSLALGLMSIVSGFIAATSEALDLFGWDDNLTIPILSGMGIWGFLHIFG